MPEKKRRATWRWVIGGVLAAFVVAGVCNAGANKAPADAPAAAPATSAATAVPTPKPTPVPAPTATSVPGIGDKASAGQWAAQLMSAQPVEQIGNEVPQGRFVIVTVAMTNLHNQTSALNSWDFAFKSADGATFSPSGNGDTALAFTPGPPVPVFTVQVQPGLTQPLRIAFDVNPAINQYTFEAAKIAFQIRLP